MGTVDSRLPAFQSHFAEVARGWLYLLVGWCVAGKNCPACNRAAYARPSQIRKAGSPRRGKPAFAWMSELKLCSKLQLPRVELAEYASEGSRIVDDATDRIVIGVIENIE